MNKYALKIFSVPVLVIIFILWITPGLVGREPWKADEPYTFGIVENMIRTGDFVVPALTGEPFLEKPPVFFITAAWFGKFFSPPLERYDAARMATAFYMCLGVLFFALASRELYGPENGAVAALLLIGCVNLQMTAHKLITDVALFSGFSVAFYGLVLQKRRPAGGGFWLGTGTGLGFLAKGLLAPGLLGSIAVVLPLLFRDWRRKGYVVSLGVALAAALPWLVIWPTLLYRRSAAMFTHWFWEENFGRFFGFNSGSVGFNGAALDSHSYYVVNLLWLAWPVVLPALWSLWYFRRSWREHPVYQLPLVSFLVILGVLSASSTNRVLYAVPLLLPLTLMAVPGSFLMPFKAGLTLNRIALAFFGALALLIWVGWFAMIFGSPAFLARKLYDFQPDYVPSVRPVLLTAALFYTVVWFVAVTRITRQPHFALINWTLGIVFTWGLAMTLWLPALNSGSSYREAFLSLKTALPKTYSCVASVGLGESERAMLEYYTGIQPRRLEVSDAGNCNLLLEERGGEGRPSAAGPEWEEIWEIKHPSRRAKDIFTLYRKKTGGS